MRRFKYSREFLQWALQPPGFRQDWHIGVRACKTKRLVGFITGVPATLRVRTNTISMAEINFLCVHKKLRSKRLAPVLIKVGRYSTQLCFNTRQIVSRQIEQLPVGFSEVFSASYNAMAP